MFYFLEKKLHITYSFVTQRITSKDCLGILFLENLISVTWNKVFGITFAILSGWSVVIAKPWFLFGNPACSCIVTEKRPQYTVGGPKWTWNKVIWAKFYVLTILDLCAFGPVHLPAVPQQVLINIDLLVLFEASSWKERYHRQQNRYSWQVVLVNIIMDSASWGPIFWPFLSSPVRAPTIKAVRGTAAIRGIFDN